MPQIVSPSVPSGAATITERYDALVASGTIKGMGRPVPKLKTSILISK